MTSTRPGWPRTKAGQAVSPRLTWRGTSSSTPASVPWWTCMSRSQTTSRASCSTYRRWVDGWVYWDGFWLTKLRLLGSCERLMSLTHCQAATQHVVSSTPVFVCLPVAYHADAGMRGAPSRYRGGHVSSHSSRPAQPGRRRRGQHQHPISHSSSSGSCSGWAGGRDAWRRG